MAAAPVIADALRAALPEGRVVTDESAQQAYLRDQATWAPSGRAAAVVRPRTTDEVATGLGLFKAGGLHAELGEPVVALHRAVRRALDPHGILNPGKVVGATP